MKLSTLSNAWEILHTKDTGDIGFCDVVNAIEKCGEEIENDLNQNCAVDRPLQNIESFRKELESLINRHSMENGSNTPDWIIADYLLSCLSSLNIAVRARQKWYTDDAEK